MKVLFIRGVGVFTVLIGIFLIQHAGKNILEYIKSSNWPSVEGKIITSKVGTLSGSSISRKTPTPMAMIQYSYKVAGICYTSSRKSLNEYGSNINGQQQEIVDRYPLGTDIKVFYNPTDPSKSIIEKSDPIGAYITTAGGIIFTLIGYFFIFKVPYIFSSSTTKKST